MASRDAAVFAHDAVLLTLMASTAQSYLRTVAWRERVAIARYNLTAAERVLGLVESRYRVGSASAQETAQQRTLVADLVDALYEAGADALEPVFAQQWRAASSDDVRLRAVIDQVASLTDVSASAWHARHCGMLSSQL